jgi:hypothetical protein
MHESDTATDVDFETFGITLKGELFQRAKMVLANLPAWNDREFRFKLMRDDPLRYSYDLVNYYVVCQLRVLRHYKEDTARWVVRRIVDRFFNVCLKRSLRDALAVKEQIEQAANNSELHAVALEINHEYESYCANEEKIKAHRWRRREFLRNGEKNFWLFWWIVTDGFAEGVARRRT